MHNITDIAAVAANIIRGMPYDIKGMHGIEVAPGFFNIYNTLTGQSKVCVLHEESGFIFKTDYSAGKYADVSGMRFEDVTIGGVTFGVRLPVFYDFSNALGVVAQEYIIGESCDCDQFMRCDHQGEIARVTTCRDTHKGNWKFFNGDIVLFDFDGIIV